MLKRGYTLAEFDRIWKSCLHLDKIAQKKALVDLSLAKSTASIRARDQGRHGLVYFEHALEFALQHNLAGVAGHCKNVCGE